MPKDKKPARPSFPPEDLPASPPHPDPAHQLPPEIERKNGGPAKPTLQ